MPLTEADAEALVAQLDGDAATLHAIVQGPDDAEVPTENGDVPTVAKVLADAAAAIADGVAAQIAGYLEDGENEITASLAEAEAWATEAEDVPVDGEGESARFSALHHAAKAAASDEGAGDKLDKAEAWADEAEDTPVEEGPDRFSARHWSAKAEGFRDAAAAIAASLTNVMDFKGGWDASANTLPADPDVGDLWTITHAGTVASIDYRVGDEIIWGPSETWVHVGRDLTATEIVALLTGTFTDAAHGARGGGTQHAAATTETAGFMSAADKAALDAVPTALADKADTSAVTAALNDKMDDPDANGLVARTGTNGAAAARTLTGTFARLVVTNGDGVSGNPTINLPGYSGSLGDDTAVRIGLGAAFAGHLLFYSQAVAIKENIFTFRAGSTRRIEGVAPTSSGTAVTLLTAGTTLNGTTGVDGDLTISVGNGWIDLENRTGQARVISAIILGREG